MREVTRESGLIELVEEPKERVKTQFDNKYEDIEGAFCGLLHKLIPDLEIEEITIGCMVHGPSPRKTLHTKDKQWTLPCIGCNPQAWASLIEEVSGVVK